jgi:hypothetical protein
MKKLLLTALLTLTSPLALALNDKPTPAPYQQLEGTFVLVRSVPEIEEDKAEGRFNSSLFFAGQKIKFEYLQTLEGDAKWDGFHEFRMTLYPPFSMNLCNQEFRYYLCKNNGTYIPYKPLIEDAFVKYDESLPEDYEFIRSRLASINMIPQKQYFHTITSSSGITYYLYFYGDETPINSTHYNTKENEKGKNIISVFQIFKRVKNE